MCSFYRVVDNQQRAMRALSKGGGAERRVNSCFVFGYYCLHFVAIFGYYYWLFTHVCKIEWLLLLALF